MKRVSANKKEPVKSNTRTYKSGSGAAAQEAARRDGWAGRNINESVRPRDDRFSCSPEHRKNIMVVSLEARTNEILCKPTCRIQNPDILRTGGSAAFDFRKAFYARHSSKSSKYLLILLLPDKRIQKAAYSFVNKS